MKNIIDIVVSISLLLFIVSLTILIFKIYKLLRLIEPFLYDFIKNLNNIVKHFLNLYIFFKKKIFKIENNIYSISKVSKDIFSFLDIIKFVYFLKKTLFFKFMCGLKILFLILKKLKTIKLK